MNKIVIRNLTRTYSGGAVVALQDIDLEVAPNESLCVLGPSGCGKTTLLRIIDCLISRDRGEVLIDGQLVTQPRPDVAVVFQHFGLFPWKRLEENIAYGLELRGKSREDISALVKRYVTLIGLKGFEKSYPHQLSGGMQQRAGLARAMAINPSVLLMDEPFGALDAMTRDLLHDEIERLWREQSLTILFVTHNVREAVRLGDRVVLLSSRPGRVVAEFPVVIPRPRRIESHPVADLAAVITDELREEVRRHGDA
jgi:NitT/TauT family transport system ATP-binding protein